MSAEITVAKQPAPPPEIIGIPEVRPNPGQEYISSTPEYQYMVTDRVLPRSVDDAERDFGDDIYDRMLNDPILCGVVDALKILTLEHGQRFVPSVNGESVEDPDEDETDPQVRLDYEQALLVQKFVTHAHSCINLKTFFWDMLDAIAKGHRLAEINFDFDEEGDYPDFLVLDSLKPKPKKNYGFVLDNFNNVKGVLALVPGVASAILQGVVYNWKQFPNAIPKKKFFVLTFGERDGDPRGRAGLRAVYAPWREKQIARPEHIKFLALFGGGMLTANVGEGAQPMRVEGTDGAITEKSPLTIVREALQQLKNGGVAAFPFGSEFEAHVPDAEFSTASLPIVIAKWPSL